MLEAQNTKLGKALELQELFQQKQYQNLPIGLQDHFNQESKLSDGAILCWQLLQRLSFYDEQWSVQISVKDLSDKLGKHERQTARLLRSLEDGGYIKRENVKSGNVNLASRIYVRLPKHVIEILKKQPKRAKAIKKCGTVATDSYVTDVTRDSDNSVIGGYDKNVMTNSNINNNKIYNNTDRVIASKSNKINHMLDHSSFVVNSCDGFVINKLDVSKARDVEVASNEVRDPEKEIDFFVDELKDPVDIQRKSAEKIKIKRCIDGWQKQLDELPDPYGIQDISKRYVAIKKNGTLESWIKQYQNKLAQLDKPVKQENIELANGERRLTEGDCKKLNTVLVKAYRANKITLQEAQKTLRLMVYGILHGYYQQENVAVAKSVNSVIKKFKNNEWDNEEASFKDKPSRPQPPFWYVAKFRNKINLGSI